MRVKICGLMRPQDVNAALNEGADALGFVVDSPSSPRNLTFPEAKKLMKAARLFSTRVAVTSQRDSRRVLRICEELKPDALQLHYHTPELIHFLREKEPATRLILATPIHDNSSLRRARNFSHYSDAVLADSPSPTRAGGTGKTHDWHLTARIRNAIYPHPLILAGGLTTKNVKTAIEQVNPFAVDVSSGVEKTVGIKDHGKIREFIMNAKRIVL
jgi:phosphoribosylanthranilate isomerase